MVGEADKLTNMFRTDALADAEQQARQVLRERGLSEDEIVHELERIKRPYPDWQSDPTSGPPEKPN